MHEQLREEAARNTEQQTMGRVTSVFQLLALSVSAYTCPDYSAIRQPSVDASAFDVEELSGVWYMVRISARDCRSTNCAGQVATTEPTMPSFCKCTVNNITINKPSEYEYTNANSCMGAPVTIHIKGAQCLACLTPCVLTRSHEGELSKDPDSPGALHETAALFNHTIAGLDPNYGAPPVLVALI